MTGLTLERLGFSPFFADQVTGDDRPARVWSVNRRDIDVLTPEGSRVLVATAGTGHYAVGDWVLHDGDRVTGLLERHTLLSRRAAGGHSAVRQNIAANVDTLGIVTSCNDDFNEARLERYIALAAAAGCEPVLILTKPDKTDDSASYAARAATLLDGLTVLVINAKDAAQVHLLDRFCADGLTFALVGSSGVGKTTLQNTLTGTNEATGDIREDDAKGRHTTTSRSLRATIAGGWLIDTPGIRELRLTDAAAGIDTVFADVAELAASCRFSDCQHATEPGCQIRAAIDSGDLDPARYDRWKALQDEDRENTETVIDASSRYGKTKPIKGKRSGRSRS